MQKLKLYSNQSGVSMVMVLMGFALAGVISLAMMKMNEVGLKRVKTREAKDDRREFLKNMSMVYLGTQEACTDNFGALDVSVNQNIATIQDESGATVVTANTTQLGEVLQVGDITLLAFVPDDGGSSLQGYCDLQIELQLQETATGKTKAYGGNRLETIRLGCTVNQQASPSNIQTCSPSSTGTDDAVWNLVEDAGNQFVNWSPFNGSGGLIIGAPSADIMADDTAAINMNMTGNSLGDITAPLIGTNIDHSIKLGEGGVLSSSGSFGFASRLNPATIDENCFFIVNDWGGGNNSVEYLMEMCPNLTTFGAYQDTGISNKMTEIQAQYSLMARDASTLSHVSLLTMGAPDTGYILSMNGFKYDPAVGGTTYDTQNFDGNAAFMVMAKPSTNAVKWYMDRVDQPTPNDTEVLFGDDDLYEIARFEPNFNLSFGDKTNYLPTYAGATNGKYVWLMGERNAVHDLASHTWLIGENNSVLHSSNPSQFEFIFGFTNSIEEADDFNVVIGYSNLINDGGYNFVFGAANEIYADNGYTALMGYGHYAGDDADYGFAYGEGAMLLNRGEVSFGKYPDNISTPEEQSIFTVGGGTDHSNRFNNLLLTEDGHLELKVGSLITYEAAAPVYPLTAYLIPPQTSEDIGGTRNSSWITNNLKPMCADDGTSCDYFSYNTADNQYGYAALELSDSGELNIYHRGRALAPTATATPGVVNATFLDPAEGGGNKIATFLDDDVQFHAHFNNVDENADITVTGTCTANRSNSSDRRLKTKIKDISVGLNEILQLEPKSYQLKKNDQSHVGFIAQEVKQIFSNVVKKIKYQSSQLKKVFAIYYAELVAPTVKAMFELKELLEEKIQRIKALRDRLKGLEAEIYLIKNDNAEIIQALCEEKILKPDLCR